MRAKKHGTKSGLRAAWKTLATETKIMRNLATLAAAAALVAVFGFVGAAQADKPIGGLHCGGTQAHPCLGEGKFYEMNFGFGTRGGGIIGLMLLVAGHLGDREYRPELGFDRDQGPLDRLRPGTAPGRIPSLAGGWAAGALGLRG